MLIGSSVTIDVSTVALPSLPWTRLPTLTRWRLTRPAIGARTWVNSMLSLAAFSAPSACISAARAACKVWRRWSTMDSETALVWTKVSARSSSRFASSALARASESWPSACSATASKGRASITYKRSPGLTNAPSRNSTLVTNPPTRARTWTSSTASNRPVNSSQSVTVRLVGCATVTSGGPAAACCGGLSPQPDRLSASSAISGRRRQSEWILEVPVIAKRFDFSVALNFHPLCTFATIDGGGCHNVPRRDQDEIGCQSVQESAWIKQNSYPSPVVFQNITIEQTDRIGINRREGDIERPVRRLAGQSAGGTRSDMHAPQSQASLDQAKAQGSNRGADHIAPDCAGQNFYAIDRGLR